MSRTGQNGGGRGGRSYRLNWTDMEDGADFGDYSIRLHSRGTAHPYKVLFRGTPMLRAHGAFEGYQCFASVENAKRWVEKRIKTLSPP